LPSETEVIRAALKGNPETHAKLRKLAQEGKIGTFAEIPPDEPLTLVAAVEHYGIVGAKKVTCTTCAIGVWISPSTQEMLKGRGAAPTAIICVPCFRQTIKERREEERTQ
jgi:hypothetical protein